MTAAVVPLEVPPAAEWLEPDGLGGFASGTVGGIRTPVSYTHLTLPTIYSV